MKKTLALLLALMLTISFTACGGSSGGGDANTDADVTTTEGDNPEDTGDDATVDNADVVTIEGIYSQEGEDGTKLIYEFKSDGTLVFWTDDQNPEDITDDSTGTYTVDGDTISISYSTGTEQEVIIEGDTIIFDDVVLTKE